MRDPVAEVARALTARIDAGELVAGNTVEVGALVQITRLRVEQLIFALAKLREQQIPLGASALIVTGGGRGLPFWLVDPNPGMPTHERVARMLAREIELGRLNVGDAPPYEVLAARLGRAPSTIKSAVARLGRDGTPLGTTGLVVIPGYAGKPHRIGRPGEES